MSILQTISSGLIPISGLMSLDLDEIDIASFCAEAWPHLPPTYAQSAFSLYELAPQGQEICNASQGRYQAQLANVLILHTQV